MRKEGCEDMTEKGENEIISISLPKEAVRVMDGACDCMGYKSRSEFVRDAVRAFVQEKDKIDRITGIIEGVLILVYDHTADNKVSAIRHSYDNVFRSFVHSDFREVTCKCCEVLIFSGEAEKVRKAFYELRTVRHVEEAHLLVTSRKVMSR